MKPIASPPASLHEKNLLHYYAMQWWVGENTVGYAGLQTDGHYYGEKQGKVVNFSIWNSTGYDSAHVDARAETNNHESKGARIMLPYEWEDGEAYEFVLLAVEDNQHGYAWRLEVNGTLIGRILTDASLYPMRDYAVAFGEDMHWWHTYEGRRGYACEEMEPSALQLLGVKGIGFDGAEHAPTGSDSWISRDSNRTVTGTNGHVTTLCDTASVEDVNGGVQHNLGYAEGR